MRKSAKNQTSQFKNRETSILEAAKALLVEIGEDKITVEQIAERADIGKGTIYKHFQSKNEIFACLLFDYEYQIKQDLEAAIEKGEQGDYSAPAVVYFESRMSDPALASLFQRLEKKLTIEALETERINTIRRLRGEVFDKLNAYYGERIKEGRLFKNVPPYYYYMAYWALTQGAVELWHNPLFEQLIQDREDFKKFIVDVGVHMGIKDQDQKVDSSK